MDVANVPPEDRDTAQEIVGYLNFSTGTFDPQFYRAFDRAFTAMAEPSAQESAERSAGTRGADPAGQTPAWARLGGWLKAQAAALQGSSPAFANTAQATAVVELAFDRVLPEYRAFHRDILLHQPDENLFQPYFLARVCQTLLQVGPASDGPDEVVRETIDRLNCFLGHRPVAVLNNEQKLQPYDHEWVAPIPVYLEGAGLAGGRYHDLVAQALAILRETDPDVRDLAWFDPQLLRELAIDPRSYDFDHPVNKRPNYHFGQWDPHEIDTRGRYRRFVLQDVTLDAVWRRTQEASSIPPAELLFEAGAVLAGTMLMASAVSGNAPDAHDSGTTLSTLLPRIVRCREQFYARLLARVPGAHGERLRAEAARLHQPFAAARQHLNQRLAKLRAVQLQHVRLAQLFAQMGYADAARRQAQIVPVASARMLCEINGLMTTIHQKVDRRLLREAASAVPEAVALLHRAIECGALVDPWSILGSQGQFSLFPAMENSVRDHRVDVLTHLMKRLFSLLVRLIGEAAATGEDTLLDHLHGILLSLSQWWDRFASEDVSGIDSVSGSDASLSALQVAAALRAWHAAGEGTGDMTFWRKHAAHFTSPKTYALVAETLLDRGDHTAAMGLLMQWLAHYDETPLVEGEFSFGTLTLRWLNDVLTSGDPNKIGDPNNTGEADDPATIARRWELVGRFFDYLEANADEQWSVPRFDLKSTANSRRSRGGNDAPAAGRDAPKPHSDDDDTLFDELIGEDPDEEEDEDAIFGAAYENVVYRDSTRDGNEGNTLSSGDESTEFELEGEARRLINRLAFLDVVAKLWKTAAVGLDAETDDHRERVAAWRGQVEEHRRGLLRLLDEVETYQLPAPRLGPEALFEYDRRRQVRDELLGRIVLTCVETIDAARLLAALSPDDADDACPAPPAEAATEGEATAGEAATGDAWERCFVQTVRALKTGDVAALDERLPRLRALLGEQPVLYVPLSKGGRPREIVAAHGVQSAVGMLLQTLPRAGRVGEACRLVGVVQHMERHRPVGDGAVTEFDRLFQLGFDAAVHALIDSIEAASRRPLIEEESQSLELFEGLQTLTEGLLRRWNAHARSLRLSSLERGSEKKRWEALVAFISAYGADLFTPKFLNLGNLRAVSHQRVDVWLKRLEEDEDAEPRLRLLDDLDVKIPRREAVELLSIVVDTLIENYSEFKDYNSTTTQSDHGELLYILLDFLRLRTAYERFAWNLRPVLMVHETLVRRRKTATAELWRRALTERTQDAADWHQTHLRELVTKYGVQLPTIADRLSERFVRSLAVDRLRALIQPALEELQTDDAHTAFSLLEQELHEFTDHPTGSGLDVPAWLTALEEEVREAQSATDRRASRPAALVDHIPKLVLAWDDVMAQLRTWDTAG